jgi:magnesium-transporting ATPase (P-type)
MASHNPNATHNPTSNNLGINQNQDQNRISFSNQAHEKESDPERANSAFDRERSKSVWSIGGFEGLDEYTALQRYILTYRDKRPGDEDGANAADAKKGKTWWQFWRAGDSPKAIPAVDPGAVPAELLATDIRQGLNTTECDTRRKRYGMNELTSEKENLLKKFLGFFTGPILYGTFFILPCVRSQANTAKLWKLLLSWPPVFRIGSISVSSAVFCSSTPSSVGTKRSRPPMS